MSNFNPDDFLNEEQDIETAAVETEFNPDEFIAPEDSKIENVTATGRGFDPKKDTNLGMQIAGAMVGFVDTVPGLKQATAAIRASEGILQDKETTWAQRYRANLMEAKKAAVQSDYEVPGAAMVGQVGGFIGSSLPVIKGAQAMGLVYKAGKGASLMAKAGGIGAVFGANVVADTAIIASKEIIDAETTDLKEMGDITGQAITESLVGNAMGLGLGMAAKAAATGVGRMATSGSDAILNTEAGKQAMQFMRGKFKVAKDALTEMKDTVGLDYVESVIKKTGIDPNNFDIPAFKSAIKNRKGVIGREIEEFYSQLDSSVGAKVDTRALYNNLMTKIDDMFSGSTQSANKAQALKNMIAREFTELAPDGTRLPKSVSLSDLHRFRKLFNDKNKNILSGLKGTDRDAIGGVITDTLQAETKVAMNQVLSAKQVATDSMLKAKAKIEQQLNKPMGPNQAELVQSLQAQLKQINDSINMNASNIGPDFMKKLTELNKEYSTLSKFKNKVIDGLELPDKETVMGAFSRNLFNLTNLGYGAAGTFINPAVGAAVAVTRAGLRTVVDKSDRIIKAVGDETGTLSKVRALADWGITGFEDPYVAKLIPSLYYAANDPNLSDEEYVNLINDLDARKNLYLKTIDRNEASVRENMNDILQIAGNVAPDLAELLSKRMELGEDTGDVMDQLSKNPEMARFFKPGLGWNGKVYSDEDKATVIEQVQELYKSSGLTTAERRQLEFNVFANGTIPDFETIKITLSNKKPKNSFYREEE